VGNWIFLAIMGCIALLCIGVGVAVKFFKKYTWVNGLNPDGLPEEELERAGNFTFWSLIALAFCLTLMGIFGFFNSTLPFIIVIFLLLIFSVFVTTYSYSQGWGGRTRLFRGRSIRPGKQGSGGRAPGTPRGKPSRIKVVLLAVCMSIFCLAMSGILFWSFQDNSILVDNTALKITGMYGKIYPLEQIASVELMDTIDWSGSYRRNGASIGEIRKGYFELKEYGKTRVFVSSLRGPYLLVKSTGGETIVIARVNPEETLQIYNDLTQYMR